MSGPDGLANLREVGIPDPVGWEDPVTGLLGPDFWHRLLASEVARSFRYRRPLTVVLLDLEGLDALRPMWDDALARRVIHETAQCVRQMARSSDQCTRIGPTRFGILLTETDEVAAINFVERVREAGPPPLPQAAGSVRFRFGWASPARGETAEAVMRRAESRMAADRDD